MLTLLLTTELTHSCNAQQIINVFPALQSLVLFIGQTNKDVVTEKNYLQSWWVVFERCFLEPLSAATPKLVKYFRRRARATLYSRRRLLSFLQISQCYVILAIYG